LIPLPQASPQVVLKQAVGLTNITVDYHAPSVKNRTIWQGLVPYGQVWRAGANENTIITFSDTVRVNGKSLPAGQYSFYVMPRSDQDWELIFNRVITHWGAEGYQEKDDVLRVPVVPEASAHHETLLYWFSDLTTGSAHFNLSWEKKTVSLLIDTNVQARVVAGIQKAVAARPNDWQLLAQAADYLVQNNLNAEQALRYIDESIRLQDVYTNNWIKARLLASKQDFDTAIVYGRKAIKLGDKDDDAFKSKLPNMRVALIEWQSKAY
jgi:tetratricopeptide (TPR) repeat protein